MKILKLNNKDTKALLAGIDTALFNIEDNLKYDLTEEQRNKSISTRDRLKNIENKLKR